MATSTPFFNSTATRLTVMAALALTVLVVSSCSDEAPSGTNMMTNPNNGPGNNTAPNNTEPGNNNVAGVLKLEHVTSQSESMNANSRLTLSARLVDPAGTPVADRTLRFTIENGNPNGTGLNAQTAITQGDGVASQDLNSGQMEANFDVRVSVDNDDTIQPIVFTINVQSKEFASYSVVVNYEGHRNYTNNEIEVRLFPAAMGCDVLDYHVLLSAEAAEVRPRDAAGFPMTFNFANLPNNTGYTAHAVAYADGVGQVIGSWGCNDEAPVIMDGINPEPIQITMNDNLPIITGTWDITSRFDLTQAVPDAVAVYLDPILDFFTDPAGTLVDLALDQLERYGVNLDQFRDIAAGIAQDLLESAINGNDTVGNIFAGAGDVTEILRNFQLQGQIQITPEQVDEFGLVGAARIQYFTFGYRWRLACAEGEFDEDPSCGDRFISFADAGLDLIDGNWSGAVVPNANVDASSGRVWFHELSVEDHPVDLQYGQIILFLIEKLALPALFGDPTIDSLEALLQNFINCEEIFDNNLFQTVCETVLDEASDLATGFLSDQSFSYENFTFGTPPGAGCALYEKADAEYGSPTPPARFHDPQFKLMGKEQTHPMLGDLRCGWDVKIQYSTDPEDMVTFPGLWSGEKKFDN